MKVTLEKQESNQICLAVEVEAQEVNKVFEQSFKKASQNLTVPGFRKGKAPRHIAEKYLRQDAIWEETVGRVIDRAYQDALSETKIEPITQPQVELVTFDKDQPLVFKAMVEIRPEVTLGAYQGLEIAVAAPADVTDDKVDEILTGLSKRHGLLKAVETPAKLGDVVVIDYHGTLNGDPLPQADQSNFLLEMSEGNFAPGFCEGLVGLSAGDEKDIEVHFPEDAASPVLAGKTAVFHVKLNEVKERELHPVDDELATLVGAADLADLKGKIREELEGRREEELDSLKQQTLLEKVVDNAQVDVPESMLERELQALWMTGARQLQQAGATQDELKADWESFKQREDARQEATRRIKTSLVLGTIAREEGITLSNEEVNSEIEAFAGAYGVPAEQVKKQLYNENKVLSLMDELLSIKILTWLTEKNEITLA